MPSTTKIYAQPSFVPPLVVQSLHHLLWWELPWVLLLGFPLTLPGRFLPMRYTPTLILLLFVFWPLRGWLSWRRSPVWFRPLMLPIGGVLLALMVSLAVASDLRFAWLMAAHLALGIALFVALIAWPPARRWPSLVALGMIGVALILSVIGPPLTGRTILSARAATLFVRLTPLVKSWGEALNPNILAGGLLLAIPLSLAWALASWGSTWWMRLVALLRAVLLLGVAWWLIQILLLTESRGALLATALSLVLVLLLRWPQLTGPTLVLTFLGLVWLLFNDPWAQLNAVMANGMAHDYNSRMEIWVRSWQAFRSHLLTGIGIGGFVPLVVESMIPIRMPLTLQVTHAHNLLLQVGVDLGVLGLVAYVACMVMSGIYAARAWRHGDATRRALAGGALAALTALNIHGLLDAPLWNSKLAFLPWLLFALAVLLAHPAKEVSRHGTLERGQEGGKPIDEDIL